MRDRIHDMARRANELPTLPEVYHQVEQASRDPSVSAHVLAQIISRDPVTSARLLRLANSARYALADRVTTVTRAVSILGQRTVRETVLVTAVFSLLPQEPHRREMAERFWRHAVAVGTAASVMGGAATGRPAEEFFVAGLLHDIGKLFWLRFFPDELEGIQAAAEAGSLSFLDSEMAMTGTNHVRLGRILARRWRLPEALQDAIGFHHEGGAIAGGNALLCHAVQAGDAVVHALELDGPTSLPVPRVAPEAWTALRIGPDAVPALLDAVVAEYTEQMDMYPLAPPAEAEPAGARGRGPVPAGAVT